MPSSNISDEQIADLISKLQQLIPEIRNARSSSRVSLFFYTLFMFISEMGYTHNLILLNLWGFIGISFKGSSRDLQLHKKLTKRGGRLKRPIIRAVAIN